jgi:parallel beta-helix repeat protein
LEDIQMKKGNYTVLVVLFTLLVLCPVKSMAQNIPPIADAGLSRYTAQDLIVLDGTGSYDPDNSGLLSYIWRQIAGPSVVIIDANTATPTIGGSMQPGTGRDKTPKLVGFTQTDAIQECEFELEVSDGELTSLPDTVKVIIVPDFGADTLRLENPPFDREKPTVIHFGGGNCITGSTYMSWGRPDWAEKANIISFTSYGPDPSVGGLRTYYRNGDMIIVYLSSVAPDYNQLIQTMGLSTGGQPAVDVGIHLNLSYADVRYAINRVTFLDATTYCRDFYSESITAFLGSSVDGEQCWADAYVSTTSGGGFQPYPPFHENVLNVWFPTAAGSWLQRHLLAYEWYKNSLVLAEMNNFNNGIVAGAYWSVIGQGKNLQLASTPDAQTYRFHWYGDASSGYMDFYDEPNHPGRLPEPVTLVGPADGALVDANGAVLSCKESENAVGYKLLFGPDPYRVMDYGIISETPSPPTEVITTFPFEKTWWTVKVRDQYGSTIYADPIRINAENVTPPVQQMIENVTIGKGYGSIQDAIDEAEPGDEIVIGAATYQYLEKINFKGKNLTVRSTDPNDPAIVAATVINGGDQGPVVTFSGGEDASCVLAGLTITGGNTGIYCYGASPTIANCTIAESGSVAIELWGGSEPTIIKCNILGDVIVRLIVENLTTGEKYDYIQSAINDAGFSDEIVVGPGVYQENISFKGKNLTLRSTDPNNPAIVAATIITGNGNENLVTFSSRENANCVLAGFTITDANNGIYCSGASPTITNCSIAGNAGAGIELWESNPTITDCTIADNAGAGIELYHGSNPTITNCCITANGGSGIEMLAERSGRFTIFNYPIITNCTIAGNLQHGISGGIPTIANSIIWANSPQQIADTQGSVTYSNIQGGWPGEGNIDADPLFADPSNGDYHLKSQAGRWESGSQSWVIDEVTSPCIDAGKPGTPVGLEPLPNGGIINMGAYGGTAEASKSPAN